MGSLQVGRWGCEVGPCSRAWPSGALSRIPHSLPYWLVWSCCWDCVEGPRDVCVRGVGSVYGSSRLQHIYCPTLNSIRAYDFRHLRTLSPQHRTPQFVSHTGKLLARVLLYGRLLSNMSSPVSSLLMEPHLSLWFPNHPCQDFLVPQGRSHPHEPSAPSTAAGGGGLDVGSTEGGCRDLALV